MAHVRRQIRDAVAARLTGLATTGARVAASRVHPVAAGAGPTLAVYTVEEEAERTAFGRDPLLDRALSLAVEIYVQAEDFDDVIDQVAAEVEAALGGWEPAAPKLREVALAATEISAHGEGDIKAGIARLTFDIRYVTRASEPSIAL